MALLILQNFHVFAAGNDDKDGPKTEYKRGMTIERSAVPAGHSADDWIAKELVRDTEQPQHDEAA